MKGVVGLLVASLLLSAGCQALLPVGGSPSPSPTPSTSPPNVSGHVVAGPICPVERFPPDPSCAPRAVAGATLLVNDASGRQVDALVSDADGAFSASLPPGSYTLVAQPVEGLMGAPTPIAFTVALGSPVELTVEYDTGIR